MARSSSEALPISISLATIVDDHQHAMNDDETDTTIMSTSRYRRNSPIMSYHPGTDNCELNVQQNIPNTSTKWKSNFMAWKRKKDSKIVGLKNYGLESPRHQLHNPISDDGSHQNCHDNATTMKCDHNHCNGHGQNQYTTTKVSSSSSNRLFAVEKEEEMVRNNVTKNPFVLFYLGNLAALKVILFYFSTYHFILA
jgi:hypothetical protein